MVSKQYYNCGATTNTLDVPRRQLYCCYKTNIRLCFKKHSFEIKFPFVDPNVVLIPNYISPNNDGVNDTGFYHKSMDQTQKLLLNSRGEVYKQIIIRIIGRRTNLILSL
jgi:hypothetical protein